VQREIRLQRDRALRSLVAHVKTATGSPHWETLVDLINCWDLVTIEQPETLTGQVARSEASADKLDLFLLRSRNRR
jgi:hypothetical protein